MRNLNISLPAPLKQFVDEQVAKGRYSNASEYVRELIRADEKKLAEQQLETLLLDGVHSEETPLTSADWDSIRAEAQATLATRKK